MTRPYCRRPAGCVASKTGPCPLCQPWVSKDGRERMQQHAAKKAGLTVSQRAREKAQPIPLASVQWGRE